ncbi:hypothetical protein ANN_26694 [Periplaneta americana]|uniref:PiggyBac transposable element-derived protein domain-containing protein n=1 Tax=Periplaneta americana TaxID=6978 RepID=A0ABQ8RYY7_PERAM|nr:hypothetical protein ANN_26694 [Periplaneta americana]
MIILQTQTWFQDNSKGNGMEACYLTMSAKRFRFLLRCLRFDDVRTRDEHKEINKLAPVREVFEIIVNNFQRFCYASEYLTFDEQLLAFRGNCQFWLYIPSKPAKYGIKVFALGWVHTQSDAARHDATFCLVVLVSHCFLMMWCTQNQTW